MSHATLLVLTVSFGSGCKYFAPRECVVAGEIPFRMSMYSITVSNQQFGPPLAQAPAGAECKHEVANHCAGVRGLAITMTSDMHHRRCWVSQATMTFRWAQVSDFQKQT